MTCWQDFGLLVDSYIESYTAAQLSTATLQAALAVGSDLGGFTDHYSTAAEPFTRQPATQCAPRIMKVSLPVGAGWSIGAVFRVKVNGVAIDRRGLTMSYRCMRYDVECATVIIDPAPCGNSATVDVDFTVTLDPGATPSTMPDFLFTTYNQVMLWKILEYLFSMQQDHRSAQVYAQRYNTAIKQHRVHRGLGNSHIVGGATLWRI